MQPYNFRIRTITAGLNVKSVEDIASLKKGVAFLLEARKKYLAKGYEVQTIRIALPHFYLINDGPLTKENIKSLFTFDDICAEEGIMLAIGDILPPDTYNPDVLPLIQELIKSTKTISFHTAISSLDSGISYESIKMAAKICYMLAQTSSGGEANFKYTASANCPPGIPYFPTAYHDGPNSFGIGLESANIFSEALENTKWQEAKDSITKGLIKSCKPILEIGERIAQSSQYIFNGIDASTAPGLDASIGAAVEKMTGVPFGCASTLSACAVITDALKSLPFKTCGYSGLMLPVIEDKILAQRASEKRFTVEELLLFSAVSGTGLDVVPIPGDTSTSVLRGLYTDMASLSLKYNSKILSARLFPIPDKKAGELVEFDNPYLTGCRVMHLD